MHRTLIIIAASLAACVAAAAIVFSASRQDTARGEPARSSTETVAHTDSDTRLRALETAISEERAARQLLEEQVLALSADVERLGTEDQQRVADRSSDSTDSEMTPGRFRNARGASREQALLDAGFTPERVEWITEREEALRFQAMQTAYELRNSGAPVNFREAALDPVAMLRAELGDAEYERYLLASNRPTSVDVGDVLASSPAASAGLQSGDKIIAYDGQRVFNGAELMQRTMESGSGSVVIDVLRDGSPMQIVVPRGPIGIEIGRLRRP